MNVQAAKQMTNTQLLPFWRTVMPVVLIEVRHYNTVTDSRADASKLNNTVHYISIDGRPVTAARGTIKEVVKLYRQYIRNGATISQDLPPSFDPLLVMHISCPPRSYDVNVEPMKDEVMFIKPESILSLVESLFKECYGEPTGPSSATKSRHKIDPATEAKSPFSILLAKRPTTSIESTSEPAGTLQDSRSCALPPQPDDKAPIWSDPPHVQSEDSNLPINMTKSALELSEDPDALPPRAHSNMYGLDEDDEIPSSSTGPQNVVHDTEDVGDVVARNPWSLAKINIPVRRPNELDDSSPLPTHQGSSSSSPHLEKKLSNSTPRAGTHRQPFGLRLQSPSPATSPCSPDIFQNPGPPRRPWPPRQRRNDVSELEEAPEIPVMPSTGGRHGVANLLDSWANLSASRTELPSFKRVSEIYNKDNELERTQDLASSEPLHMQNSMNLASHEHPWRQVPLGHPLKSPLLRSPAGAVAYDGACPPPNLEPVPASQHTSFKLSQSPNPELDQIMEFEHRKKAAVSHQRKAHGKAKGRGMSIVESAQLPQSTMGTSGDKDVLSLKVDRNVPEGQASAVATFDDGSDDRVADLNPSKKPSPHKNRYLAAAKRLTRGRTDESEDEFRAPGVSSPAELTDDGQHIPRIPKDDPRAYLIRHRSQSTTADAGGLSKTGLKIRRTITQRLPLEVVPPDVMLHDVVTRLDFDVRSLSETGPVADKYTLTGKNDFIAWSWSMADVLTWQDRLLALIENRYRARVSDELIAPNVGLDLRRMVNLHCDNNI